MRGNLPALGRAHIEARSIPAYAGEPAGGCPRRPASGVYPRVCGGTAPNGAFGGDCLGLSPRMRGNRAQLAGQVGRLGSIPAYAGEPQYFPAYDVCRIVYPRVCGGTTLQSPDGAYEAGLSPRMRGNRYAAGNGQRRKGSIPAYAGEPESPGTGKERTAVYPRVCGGTVTSPPYDNLRQGLSPRMRGNLADGLVALRYHGSIPAYAGEPAYSEFYPGQLEVYPRVCGGTWTRRSR